MTSIKDVEAAVERLTNIADVFGASAPAYLTDPGASRIATDLRTILASHAALVERAANLKAGCAKSNDEVCQVLGKALGYPWFKDDPVNFPGATEADGVCVGEHVAESMADEAARVISEARASPPPPAVSVEEVARVIEREVRVDECQDVRNAWDVATRIIELFKDNRP